MKDSGRRWRSAASAWFPTLEARQGLLPNAATGVYSAVPNLNQSMLPYMAFWPQPNGAELLSNGVASGAALSYNNPKESIREDFGTLRTDYLIGDRDTVSAVYTIDDGDSLIPLADPLFASGTGLRMQVASLEETHIFSPQILNTFRAGYSRAALQSRFGAAGLVSGEPFVRQRGRARRHRHQRRRHHHGQQRHHHFRRPQQCRRRLESEKPLHLFRYGRDEQGKAPDQHRCLVSAAARQREYRLAPARPGELRQPDHLPPGHRDYFPGGARPQRTGLEESLWGVVFRRCHQTAVQSHAAGRHPARMEHWLERGFRQGRQLRHRFDRRARDHSAEPVRLPSPRTTRSCCSAPESAWRGTHSATASPPSARDSEPITP